MMKGVVQKYAISAIIMAIALFGAWKLATGYQEGIIAPHAGWLFALAASLYMISHVFRGIRLTIIANNFTGIPGRPIILMSLLTAPLSFILPFNLCDLLKVYLLRKISGKGGTILSISTILTDRAWDCMALTVGYIFIGSFVLHSNFFSVPYLYVSFIALYSFLFLSLDFIKYSKEHIIINYKNRNVIRLLPLVNLCELFSGSLDVGIRSSLKINLVLTVLIWSIELAAVAIFLLGLSGDVNLHSSIELLLNRLGTEWRYYWLADYSIAISTNTNLYTIFGFAAIPLLLVLFLRTAAENKVRNAKSIDAGMTRRLKP